MEYLFENMEKMDIQLERRRTEEQRQRAEEQTRKAEEQRQKTEVAYYMLISAYKAQGMARGDARKQLIEGSGLGESEIAQLLDKFWEK